MRSNRGLTIAGLALLVMAGCGDGPAGDQDGPLHFRSAAQLAAAIRRGEVRSRELLELYLERIALLDPELNAVVALDPDGARRRAADADAAIERGEVWGPLHGLPVTIKDAFDVVGMPATYGSPLFASNFPARNAAAVQRLIDAGAVVFGKTNVPLFALDVETFNEVYGVTNNPWDVTRTPGGSSGGAVAALAAGFAAFELGSDIGGSIRTPAHYTGVYGHHPTIFSVPGEGHLSPLAPPPGSDPMLFPLGVIGPLARSADDLELLLEVLSSPTDALGMPVRFAPARRQRLQDYRVAAWLSDPAVIVDTEVVAVLEMLVQGLESEGVRVDRVSAPKGFSLAEGSALHLEAVTTFQMSREALARREAFQHVWAEFFRSYDILLIPVAPTVAPPHGHETPLGTRTVLVNGRPEPALDALVWISIATFTGLPATVAPAGLSSTGLPVGVQILSGAREDRTTIDFARRLAAVTGAFQAPRPTAAALPDAQRGRALPEERGEDLRAILGCDAPGRSSQKMAADRRLCQR